MPDKSEPMPRGEDVMEVDKARTAPAAEVSSFENITFLEYALPVPIDLPSDNKEHEVILKEK